MTVLNCPVCARAFDVDQSPAMPFCSQRCRLVDLGRWLDEQYSMPVDPEADGETMTDWDG